MSTLKELNVKLGADITDFEKKMKSAARTLRREGRNLSDLGNKLSMAVSLPIAGIGVASIKAAGDMELLTNAMRSTMGDASAAAKEIELLRKEALKPGLNFEQALKGSVRLQAVGVDAETARNALGNFGNALALAGGRASDLDGVTLALTQIISKGKVSAEEINQLAERVPQIRKVMKDAFGTADTEELQAMGIASEDFVKRVVDEFGKLPKATGGLSNALENMAVAGKQALADLGSEINRVLDIQGMAEKFSRAVGGMVQSFISLGDGTKKTILTFVGLAAAAGPLIKVTNAVRMGVMGAKHAYDSVALATKTYTAMMGLHKQALAEHDTAIAAATTRVKSLQAAWGKMDFAARATTIGIVVTAIAAAVVIFQELNRELSTAEKIQNTLNEVHTNAAKSIAAEKVEAERLVGVLNSETDSRERKEAALKRLKEINPEYFGQLTTEKGKIEDVNTALGNYIANLQKRAKLTAANEKLVEIEKSLLDITEQIDKAEPTWLQSAANIVTAGGNAFNFAAKQTGDFTNNLKANRKELEAQKEALLKLINTDDLPVVNTPGGGSGRTEPDKKKGKDKSPQNTLKELGNTYELIAKKATIYGDAIDATAMRQGALQSAINDLLEQGVDPQSESLQTLATRYKNLSAEGIDPLTAKVQSMKEIFTVVADSMTEKSETAAERVASAFAAMGEAIGEASLSAADSMYYLASQGEASFGKLGKSALKSAADQVRGAIMSGVAATVRSALSTIPFPFNIAAGATAGALAGALFNKVLSGLKIPALAEGGLVTKPTLALIGEKGPELVTPPQKLPGLAQMMGMSNQNSTRVTGEFRIRGKDLVLSLEDALQETQRVRGRKVLS